MKKSKIFAFLMGAWLGLSLAHLYGADILTWKFWVVVLPTTIFSSLTAAYARENE